MGLLPEVHGPGSNDVAEGVVKIHCPEVVRHSGSCRQLQIIQGPSAHKSPVYPYLMGRFPVLPFHGNVVRAHTGLHLLIIHHDVLPEGHRRFRGLGVIYELPYLAVYNLSRLQSSLPHCVEIFPGMYRLDNLVRIPAFHIRHIIECVDRDIIIGGIRCRVHHTIQVPAGDEAPPDAFLMDGFPQFLLHLDIICAAALGDLHVINRHIHCISGLRNRRIKSQTDHYQDNQQRGKHVFHNEPPSSFGLTGFG